MTREDREIIIYARSAYGFLLGHDYTHTNRELAEEIAKVYDLSEPRTREVYDCLMRYPDLKGEDK